MKETSRKSQKLIHCKVCNPNGGTSIRLIEIEMFKMWEFLLRSRHELQVVEPELCLWLSETAYNDNAEVFDHAGKVKKVDLIAIHIFDVEYSFTHTIERYSLADETKQVVAVLSSHIPNELQGNDLYQIEITPGSIILQQPSPKDRRLMILGLNY